MSPDTNDDYCWWLLCAIVLLILMLMGLASLMEPVQGNSSGHTQLHSARQRITRSFKSSSKCLLFMHWLYRSSSWFCGSDYYCESALNLSSSGNFPWEPFRFYPDDPLWDGQDCCQSERTCCDPPNLPWFCKELPQSTTDYLEFRICGDQPLADEDTPVNLVQLCIQWTIMNVVYYISRSRFFDLTYF